MDERDGAFELSAGADLNLQLDDLTPSTGEQLVEWSNADFDITPAEGDAELGEQLLAIGVLQPVLAEAGEPFGLEWLGDPWSALTDELTRLDVGFVAGDAAIGLVVRTNSTWDHVLTRLGELNRRPYLFVDAALHHSIVVGPLAVPGETACAGCLAGRIRQRWGDTEPPEVPAVHHDAALVAAIVRREVAAINDETSRLINATVAWDLANGYVKRDALYRVPECPSCARITPGSVSLPWA